MTITMQVPTYMQMMYALFLPPLCLWRHRSKLWLTLQDNFLELKCEVIAFEKSEKKTVRSLSVNTISCSLPVRSEGKCLGYLWKSNLSSDAMNLERVQRARNSSSFGSIQAFHGIQLSSVSTSSIVQQCVQWNPV